jgi:hypothetical protein
MIGLVHDRQASSVCGLPASSFSLPPHHPIAQRWAALQDVLAILLDGGSAVSRDGRAVTMAEREGRPRGQSLREAASVVFALTAVLPLLIFAYTLYALDVIGKPQAQISLTLAVAVSLFGFRIFRLMVSRMVGLLQAVGAAEQGPLAPQVPEAAAVDVSLPGIGTIQEFRDIAGTFDHLRTVWKAEAEPHLGRRVLVSVRNSPHPIAGRLEQVTDDGVLLDDAGRHVGVSYRRISAIEPATTA